MNSTYVDGLFSDETLDIAEDISLSDILLLDKPCADALIRALCFVRKHTVTDLATDISDDSAEVVRELNRLIRSLGHERRQEAFDGGKRNTIPLNEGAPEPEPLRKIAPVLTPDIAGKLGMGVITHINADKQQTFTSAEFDKRFQDLWLQGGQRDFAPEDMAITTSKMPQWKTYAAGARVKLRRDDVIYFRKSSADYFITHSF